MTRRHLDHVVAIATVVHTAHPERPEVFAERFHLFPAGARVAEMAGVIVGYALAHPGVIGSPPALDTLLGALPAAPDCLFLHDVALLPQGRGQGLARRLLEDTKTLATAARLRRLALVAVSGSQAMWRRFGFLPWLGDASLREKLAGYGGDAAYMTCPCRDHG